MTSQHCLKSRLDEKKRFERMQLLAFTVMKQPPLPAVLIIEYDLAMKVVEFNVLLQ